jgi:hypothetical protein
MGILHALEETLMNRIRLSAVTALIAATVHIAAAQGRPQIQVLKMPSVAQTLPVQLAEGTLSVHYNGRLDPSRTIWVRVFRDPLPDLINKYPRETPKGRCVVYTHAVRFRVENEHDQELRIADLVDFFQMAKFQDQQTLTLVFEEGDDPESNGPLRLEKEAVSSYFNNAVQMPLKAPDAMKVEWDSGFLRSLGSIRIRRVYAAEQPQPSPPPASPPLPSKVDMPPCQTVKMIPYTPLPTRASIGKTSLDALAPVAIREYQNCGQ